MGGSNNLDRRYIDPSQIDPSQTELKDHSLTPAQPSFTECYVMSVSGRLESPEPLHRALQKLFMPHSLEFVSALVEAVRNQHALDPKLVLEEERLVRNAVEEAGDEHGTSGFQDSVVWLKQETNFLSCKSDLDPTRQGNTVVPVISYELYDPRAYRDGRLCVRPSTDFSLKPSSILGADPRFQFTFEASGHTWWSSIRPFLGELSTAIPATDWREFDWFEKIPPSTSPMFEGCWVASTQDSIEVVLRPRTR